MKNILLALLPSFAGCAVFVALAFRELIKKTSCIWIKCIAFVVLATISIILYFPMYKDIVQKETNTIVAKYIDYQSGNASPGTFKAHFEGEEGVISIYVPVYTRDIIKMEAGKVYEVVYFCNSYVMKEFRLLE